jgi:hypothetical protein
LGGATYPIGFKAMIQSTLLQIQSRARQEAVVFSSWFMLKEAIKKPLPYGRGSVKQSKNVSPQCRSATRNGT